MASALGTAKGSHASAGGERRGTSPEVVDHSSATLFNVWAQPGSTHGAWGGSQSVAVKLSQHEPRSPLPGAKSRRDPFGRNHATAPASAQTQLGRGNGKGAEGISSKGGGVVEKGTTIRAATTPSATRQREGGRSFDGENMLPLGSSMRSKQAQVIDAAKSEIERGWWKCYYCSLRACASS